MGKQKTAVTLTVEQKLRPLHQIASDQFSWVLDRVEGTGLKFWRITINDGPEWSGSKEWSVDGRTLQEAISLAADAMRNHKRYTSLSEADGDGVNA